MKYLMSSVAAAAVSSLAMRPGGYARMDAASDAAAATNAKLDKIATSIGGVSDTLTTVMTRLDSVENENKEMKADAARRKADDDAAAAKKKADDDAAKARHDAEEKEKEEKRFDSMCAGKYSKRKDDDDDDSYKKRHDSEESMEAKEREGRGATKEMAADKARKSRKDAEEKEEKERAEKAKHDSQEADRKKLLDLERRIPMDASHPDFGKLLEAQAGADNVFRLFGDSAPRPLNGEDLLGYRRRIATKLKSHSTAWKEIDLAILPEAAFGVAEKTIYADAQEAAANPLSVADDQLVTVTDRTMAGHTRNRFRGKPGTWMREFTPPQRGVQGVFNPDKGTQVA